jgi:hypothetical protein
MLYLEQSMCQQLMRQQSSNNSAPPCPAGPQNATLSGFI